MKTVCLSLPQFVIRWLFRDIYIYIYIRTDFSNFNAECWNHFRTNWNSVGNLWVWMNRRSFRCVIRGREIVGKLFYLIPVDRHPRPRRVHVYSFFFISKGDVSNRHMWTSCGLFRDIVLPGADSSAHFSNYLCLILYLAHANCNLWVILITGYINLGNIIILFGFYSS